MQNKAKRKINYKRVMWCLAMMVLGMAMFIVPAFADNNAPSAGKTMMSLISLMCSMFKYVGVAIFVWAIIQFILATKRSDADSKADAVQTAVCGIALIAVATVIDALGITKNLGTDVQNDKVNSDALNGTKTS